MGVGAQILREKWINPVVFPIVLDLIERLLVLVHPSPKHISDACLAISCAVLPVGVARLFELPVWKHGLISAHHKQIVHLLLLMVRLLCRLVEVQTGEDIVGVLR